MHEAPHMQPGTRPHNRTKLCTSCGINSAGRFPCFNNTVFVGVSLMAPDGMMLQGCMRHLSLIQQETPFLELRTPVIMDINQPSVVQSTKWFFDSVGFLAGSTDSWEAPPSL